MFRRSPHPFLKSAERAVGGGGAPAATSADSIPQSAAGSDPPSAHPMDARPGSLLDDQDDSLIGQSREASSEQSSRGTRTSDGQQSTGDRAYFEPDFDPSTLEEPLQGVYTRMRAALDERLSGIPDVDTLSLLNRKAQGFDQLVHDQGFQQWAQSRMDGGEGGGTPSVGQKAASEVEDTNLLEGLDEDVQKGVVDLIQRKVDEAVSSRVNPVAEAFYNREAEMTLEKLQEQVGEDTFQRLAPRMQLYMESISGLDAGNALKLARADELEAQVAQNGQQTVEEKFHANMEGDGSFGTEPTQTQKVGTARDAISLAIDQVRSGRGWDPTKLPPGYRGE